MAKNINFIDIPCHRIVNSDGTIGNYVLGVKEKINLLKKEGVYIKKGKILDFNKTKFSFK